MRSMQHCGMDKNEMATVQKQPPRRRTWYSKRLSGFDLQSRMSETAFRIPIIFINTVRM